MTDWVELTRRKYAAYLMPAYLDDPTFLTFVNSTLDPTGTVGSIIPEFAQNLPALQQSATAGHSDNAEVTQILAGISQTATATVI